ncbi:PaaI family thioesterase [Halomonas rhizosphaerae]|uniref:Medium/long-chain acyl-CoA thioesterase YigI n=1 Tax=Halomonas rhizosphaerae TaxID=3043296 RepID=A0ABT6V342_9GAMM|nr:PaaI family thioesterase [Halomonas rhizosphaerae]MDI5892361.1 PaaI family thioesterase [Halomonas rhizosphaerae]
MPQAPDFPPANPDYRTEVERILQAAPFIRALGVEADEIAPGRCVTRLAVREDHQQQDGFVHAGVLATLADHTAGAAGASLIPAGAIVLTAEFKINLLRSARGRELRCVGRVLKPGRTLIVAESEVYTGEEGATLVAKAMVTLAVVTPR